MPTGQVGIQYNCLHYTTTSSLTILVDNFGTVVGENPDCLLLSGPVVGENLHHVCWDSINYEVGHTHIQAVHPFHFQELCQSRRSE